MPEKEHKYSLKELTKLFKEHGADDPESWAGSEINEGINQLARFSFLKAITSEIVKEDDLEWVDNQIEHNFYQPDDTGAQLPKALEEMLRRGVSRESILDLVRMVQCNTLFHVCAIIDCTYVRDTPITDWALFEVDEDGNPTRNIGGLHESLYEFDPSKRGFKPRS